MINASRYFFLLIFGLILIFPFVLLGPGSVHAQVRSSQKISNSAGGFGGTLQSNDEFGKSVADLGDLDSDGKQEVAVAAPATGLNTIGSVWILSLNSDGTVNSTREITDSDVGGGLDNDDNFGVVANAGDVDDDGVTDLAVGARLDDDADGQFDGNARGAVWILFLNADGSVSGHQKISDTAGNFGGTLEDEDWFGSDVAGIGDLDGNGVPDLAVGARRDDDGSSNRGAVWILFLESDGTVTGHQKISDTAGNFSGTFPGAPGSEAFSVPSAIGDVDGDGITDLAVGAPFDNAGDGQNGGAVWVLFMNEDGTVASHQKISDANGRFGGTRSFGSGIASPDDLNGDNVPDLLVGENFDDDGGEFATGAVWIVYLNGDGTVAGQKKISDTEGGFEGSLDQDLFGSGLSSLGDLNGDGNPDLTAGAPLDDDGAGALWVTFGDHPDLLPVELASFDAWHTGQETVELSWTTTSEQNNAGFAVEHKSSAEDDWTELGFVESAATGGTTTEVQSYQFAAEDLSVGTHRFRLKQVDVEGSTHLSKTVTVDLGMDEPVRLTAPAPNPVRNRTTLSFAVKTSVETTLRLYNVLGQQVATLYRGTPAAEESQAVDLSAGDLSSGVYFLRLRAGERTVTERMTVVR
jgi:hypothetical protein